MRSLFAWGVLVASAATAAEVPRKIPVSEFFANPTLSAPVLSDDGKTIAYIASKGDLQIIWSRPVTGGEPVPLAKMVDPGRYNGAGFGLSITVPGLAYLVWLICQTWLIRRLDWTWP